MTWIFLLIGLAAGALSGIFGIGGGLLIVPALVILAKMQPQLAAGTSLGALLLPVGLFGAISYWRAESVDVRAAMIIALGLVIGTYFGAELALNTSPRLLQRLFAVFLVIVAGRLWFSA